MAIVAKEYWYPWYPEKFANRTLHLGLAEEGAYRRLIDCYMLRGEPLPDDDRALCRLLGCSMDEWCEVREAVYAFFERVDGRLHHDKCDQMLSEQNRRGSKRSKAAQVAAKARWKNKKSGNARSNAKGMPDASSKHTSSNHKAMRGDATGQDRIGHKKENTPPPSNSEAAREAGGSLENDVEPIPFDAEPQPQPPPGSAARTQPKQQIADRFLELRTHFWPNESGLPAPTLTLETEAQQFLDRGGVIETILETLQRGIERKIEIGEGPPQSLKAFHKSIGDAIAKRANGGRSPQQIYEETYKPRYSGFLTAEQWAVRISEKPPDEREAALAGIPDQAKRAEVARLLPRYLPGDEVIGEIPEALKR